MVTTTLVFVPLSGLTSVNVCCPYRHDGGESESFRPLIGVNFCKPQIINFISMCNCCFRPLIGVNFCKLFLIT